MVKIVGEGIVAFAARNVHLVRSLLNVCISVLLMAVLATPVLQNVVPMQGANVHFEYLFFAYRYWREGEVKEDSLRKCLTSLGLVCIASMFLAVGPILAVGRFTGPLIALNLLAAGMLIFSVINMYIGMWHFNHSAAIDYVGEIYWGSGNTIHIVTAAVALIPAAFLCYEHRIAAKGAEMPAFVTPKIRRLFVIVPQLVAILLVVVGAATPQAYNNQAGYVTAWHYDIMSYDYSLQYIKDSACDTFNHKYSALSGIGTAACVVATFAFLASIFTPRRSIVILICNIVTLALILGTVGVAAGFLNAITCSDPSKDQGALQFSYGLICLFIAMGISLISIFVTALTRNMTFVIRDLAAGSTKEVCLLEKPSQ